MAKTSFSGPIYQLTKHTDGGIFIPAKYASFYTGAWTDTRIAAGDYVMRKTAAANSGQTVFYLGAHLLQKVGADPVSSNDAAHDIRGVQITSIDVVHAIGTAALTSHTFA